MTGCISTEQRRMNQRNTNRHKYKAYLLPMLATNKEKNRKIIIEQEHNDGMYKDRVTSN